MGFFTNKVHVWWFILKRDRNPLLSENPACQTVAAAHLPFSLMSWSSQGLCVLHRAIGKTVQGMSRVDHFPRVQKGQTHVHTASPPKASASPEHFTRLLPVQKPACPFLTQPFASGRHGLRHSSSWFSDITVAWSYNLERSPLHCIGPRPGLALWSCLADVRA